MTYHPDQALVCKNEFNGQDCATLSAKIWIGVMMLSLSAATAALTADVPSCTTICSTP